MKKSKISRKSSMIHLSSLNVLPCIFKGKELDFGCVELRLEKGRQ